MNLEHWISTKLDKVVDILGGGTPKTSNAAYWNGDIPWISVVDFANGNKYIWDTEKSITKKGLENSSTRILKKGQIIISARGTVGEIGVVTRDMAFNQSCYGFSGKSLLCNDFLYYLLKHNVEQLKLKTHGSVFQTITRETFSQVNVDLPPLPEQRAIADVLSALDDKIDLNRRMNQTLEQLAQALFKHMFIDNPERGEWEEGSLGDIAEVTDCLHSKKPERKDTGKLLLQLNNIRDDGLLDLTEQYFISDEDYCFWISRIEASPGDCVITNVGRVGAVSRVPANVYAALGRNMTALRCKSLYPFPTFLIELLLSAPMRREITSKIDTGTILDALNVKNIPYLSFSLPPMGLLSEFEELVSPIREKMEQNLKEISTLSELRDTLLPKLMSGQVRVV